MQSITQSIKALLIRSVAPIIGAVFVLGSLPSLASAALVPLQFAASTPLVMNSSNNWAGYVAMDGGYTSVSGAWNVPNVSASAGYEADAAWVGSGGVNTSDLIQSGTEEIIQNGAISYEAWYELLPSMPVVIPMTIHPGDAVSVALGESSPDHWQLVFRDFSSGASYQTVITYHSLHSSAEWVEEMPLGQNGFVALDHFGSVSFLAGYTTHNGVVQSIQSSGAHKLNMINGGQTLALSSGIGVDGSSFQVARADGVAPQAGEPFRVAVAGPSRAVGEGAAVRRVAWVVRRRVYLR